MRLSKASVVLSEVLAMAVTVAFGGFLALDSVVAQCEQDCNGTDSELCQGDSTGDCPSCIISPVSCTAYPGITSYTGTAIYGSIQGSKTIAFQLVACRKNKACISGNVVQGRCYPGLFVCETNGFGGCQSCTLAPPVTTDNAYSCVITDDCQGAG